MAPEKQWQVFGLGTNNWQGGGEFAPGSGILHEGHHGALAELPEVAGRSYSMWPSRRQRSDPKRKDVRVFALEHDIPICESVSPTSSYRWHSMSEEEFGAYRKRLADEVCNFMKDAEAETGISFNLMIAHHCFTNPAVLVEVNRRRVADGKPDCPIVVFSHGTALKMYQNELKGGKEYPRRFYPWMQELGIFSAKPKVVGVFTVANAQKELFQQLFPEFPQAKVTPVTMGYNQHIFRPIEGAAREAVLLSLEPKVPEGMPAGAIKPQSQKAIDSYVQVVKDSKRFVMFTGKFADWKRLDVVLHAAAKWEQADPTVVTGIVGSGPVEAQIEYAKLAYGELGLTRTFFLGPQPQDILAKLNTVSEVNMFPSKDEPFGLVFIEALACGTPVIGARSGGPVEFVHDGVGHLIEESADHSVLAQRLFEAEQKAIAEDWKRTKGPGCHKYSSETFSLVAQCHVMLQRIDKEFLCK